MKRRISHKLLALTLALCMCLSLAAPAGAADWWDELFGQTSNTAEKTNGGTTSNQPFPAGTGGSQNFRIPAIVTLNDGTIVAAADARWNGSYDGGGLDTIVSYSKDGGATWNYTFANYLGDHGNAHNRASSAFIDPALATDGNTVYMLVDLHPSGYSNTTTATNSVVKAGSGFNADGTLKLCAASGSSYDYYLDLNSFDQDGYARIYDSEGDTVDSYKVDRWFNLYLDSAEAGNIFYTDSAYHVYTTQFLYFTQSQDGGATWSAPTLINVKEDKECFYGVCPGSGCVTSDGTIIFACYGCESIAQNLRASYIYSKDQGKTWTRSWGRDVTTFQNTSSEASIAEVTVGENTYLYAFTRYYGTPATRGAYYFSADGGKTWTEKTGLDYTCGSDMGVITYSRNINGRPALLLSAHSSGGRNSGVIYVLSVEDDGSLTKSFTYSVNNGGYYAYSDLTELADGTIGLLYESGSAAITFKKYDIATLAPNATIGEGADVGGTTTEPVEKKDETTGVSVSAPGLTGVTVTAATVNALADKDYVAYDITPAGYTDGSSATVTVPLSDALKAAQKLIAVYVESGVPTDEELPVTRNADGTASFTVTHFSTYAVYAETLGESGTETTEPVTKTHTFTIGDAAWSDTIEDYNYSDHTSTLTGIVSVAVNGTPEKPATLDYVEATNVTCSSLASGNVSYQSTDYYYTPDSENYYPLYVSRSIGSGVTYSYYYKVGENYELIQQQNVGWFNSDTTVEVTIYTRTETAATPASTTVTLTPLKAGHTEVTVGHVTYQITVNKKTETINLQLGNSKTIDGVSSIVTTGLNTSVATVTKSGSTVTINGVANGTTSFETDTTIYTVVVSDAPAEGINQLVSAETVSYSSYNSIVAGDVVTGLLLSHSSDSNGTTSFVLKSGSDQTITNVSVSGDAATAQLNSNGTVTVTGNNVGTCELTVTFSDNSVTKIPVRVVQGAENSSYALKQVYYFDALYHSKLYYAVGTGNAGVDTDWTELQEGYVFTVALDSGTSSNNSQKSVILLAAKPDDGYAISSVVHSTKYSSGSWTYADGSYNFIGRSSDSTRKFGSEFTFGTNGEVSSTNSIASTNATYYYDYCYTKGGVVNKNDSSDTDYAYSMSNFQTLLNHAVDKDLMVGFLYSVPVGLRLQVISDKLPTMEKTIKAVNDESYTEGMTIELGDTITYTLTFTSYHTHKSTFSNAGTPAITYSDVKYTDELTGDIAKTLSGELTTSTPTSDGATFKSNPEDLPMDDKKTVDVSFTLTMDNFDKVKDNKLENVASVTYDYQAFQSKGSSAAEAKAEAVSCKITTPTYVVDFGLPVAINLQDVLGGATITKASVGSGSGQILTFQPTEVLPKDGTYVSLTLSSGGKTQYYGVTILPASNVLYEESFLTAAADSGWSKGTSTAPTASQQTQKTTDTGKNVFGYDGVYAADGVTGELGVWKATGLNTTTATKALTTSFYGNAFDLIGSCGPTTGRAMLIITKKDATMPCAIRIVDTRFNDSSVYDSTTGVIAQVPLAHVELDEEAEYTVEVYASGSTGSTAANPSAVSAAGLYRGSSNAVDGFDAILSAYGLCAADVMHTSAMDTVALYSDDNSVTQSEITYQDGTHVEIDSFRVYRSTVNDQYPAAEQQLTYYNILDLTDATVANAYIENGEVTSFDFATYESQGGPQNEIYLKPKQSVTFSIATATAVQVSLRAVNGATQWNNTTITSNTEMYYVVNSEDGTFTIANTGSNLLAIGNVKIKASDEEAVATMSMLSDEVVLRSMRSAYAAAPVVEPEVGFQPEKLVANAKSVNMFSKKLVTLTVTASRDVDKLVVNGKTLIPTNAWMVKMGWSSTYTYVLVDTVKRGETASFEITAYNADGASYTCTHEA